MHVLPGVGARGHDRRIFAGRGAVIVHAWIDESGRQAAVALTVVKARSSLKAIGSQQILVIGFHRSQLGLLFGDRLRGPDGMLDRRSLLNRLDHRSLLLGERRFIVVVPGDADDAGGRCYGENADRLRGAGRRTCHQEREARDESRG